VRELVVVMAVGPQRRERLLAADEPGRRAVAGPLGDLGQGQADGTEPFGQAGGQFIHPAMVPSGPGNTLLFMKFAIAIPQFYADGEFDPAAFRAYLARAEELGFESAWTQESVLGASSQFSPIEAMTYAAACTERLRLGCVVFVSTLHSPVHLAKSLATLDQLSLGRLEVGVGTGGPGRPFAAFGVDPHRYAARFTEGVTVMKALWTEPRVTFHGEFFQLENAPMEPKPFTKPHPPLWFGGASEPALRRAVRMGDGFFGAGSSATDKFAEQVQIVRRAVAEAGRPADSFPIAKRVYIAIDEDAERARNRMNAALESIYGQRVPVIEAAAVTGTPADCVREANRVAAAGAELILFTALFDQREQMEQLAAAVLPKVG
jgi:probable F420-dependent oxidoreductase